MKIGDKIIAKTYFHHGMKRYDEIIITNISYEANGDVRYYNTNIGITVSHKKFSRYFFTEIEIQRKDKLNKINKI